MLAFKINLPLAYTPKKKQKGKTIRKKEWSPEGNKPMDGLIHWMVERRLPNKVRTPIYKISQKIDCEFVVCHI